MMNEKYIKIVQNKSNMPKYVPTLILTISLFFLVSGIVQLYFLNKLISPFEQLNWSEVISIALQVEPAKTYIGAEVQAVVWLMKSLISFLISLFNFLFYFYVKKDLEICSVIAPLLNEKKETI